MPTHRAEVTVGTYVPDADELAMFLAPATIDPARAEFILELAAAACEAYISPLPDTARSVVLGIAARAYTNPTSAASEGVGPFNATWGTKTGLSVYPSERRQLRALAGRGGAFTIDPTPVDAGASLDVWNQNVTWLNGVPTVDTFTE